MTTPTSPRGIMPTPTISAPRLPSDSAPRKPPSNFETIAIAVIRASVSSVPAVGQLRQFDLAAGHDEEKRRHQREQRLGLMFERFALPRFRGDHAGEKRADDRGEAELRRQEGKAKA